MIPRDSHVTAPAEIRRLTKQARRILARLEHGPATRRELADIAANVTARISDLRAAGYDVLVTERPNGASIYRLKKGAESSPTDSTKKLLRASEPSGESEGQDLRAHNQNAPHDCNGFQLR